MEVRLSSEYGLDLPDGCYVSVGVEGSNLLPTLLKWDLGCTIQMPMPLTTNGRNVASIEIYQRIGSCKLPFISEQHEEKKVSVPMSVDTPALEGVLQVEGTLADELVPHAEEAPRRCCRWRPRKARSTATAERDTKITKALSRDTLGDHAKASLKKLSSASRWTWGSRASPDNPQTLARLRTDANIARGSSKERPPRRLLVLTDTGEEVDDEAALWLLARHLEVNARAEADVVFITGNPRQRAMRWATVLNSLGDSPKPGSSRMRYFLGPPSSRHMRYQIVVDEDELAQAGVSNLEEFAGGSYDVVLQISPLGGFAADLGALGRITKRDGAEFPMYVVVGVEGATNFPRDPVHGAFKESLQAKGFVPVHVEKHNYMNWDRVYFETMPPRLVEMILEDEWNKAVGRIPPFAASLFVRFRVNVLVNYNIVEKAFAAFELESRSEPGLVQAEEWWRSISSEVEGIVRDGYIKTSRESDSATAAPHGNPAISSTINGMAFTWESLLSRELIRDLNGCKLGRHDLAIGKRSVDDIMCAAVTLMTGKLLRIYAFDAIATGRVPERMQVESYLAGTAHSAPLDFQNFPRLDGDIAGIQREVVGNPMYDPAGMLIALSALGSHKFQAEAIAETLHRQEALLSPEGMAEAMRAGYNGEHPRRMANRLCPSPVGATKTTVRTGCADGPCAAPPVPHILVLTDAGEEADNEAALWLLVKHLSVSGAYTADVVFVTGNPLKRAMRWARILNSLGDNKPKLLPDQVRYYVGPETPRPSRSQIGYDQGELAHAGIGPLSSSPFDGGEYDAVVQLSVLTGFAAEFKRPAEGVAGALGRVRARPSAESPVFFVLGDEGMINFPMDALHTGFKESLVRQGFIAVHLDESNYIYWHKAFFPSLPGRLASITVEDEWTKAIGRIAPGAGTLFLRFRVNTNVNYDVVDKAFASFAWNRSTDPNFQKAKSWWDAIAEEVTNFVDNGYTKSSRMHDRAAGTASFGNPAVSDLVSGQAITWESVMSEVCIRDIRASYGDKLDISSLSVDEAMSRAVLLMTGKLLRIYAHDHFAAGTEPNRSQFLLYLTGSKSTPPLDYYSFPRFIGDILHVKKAVLGNPMYDAACVLVALAALSSTAGQVKELTDGLRRRLHPLDLNRRSRAMLAALKGATPEELNTIFFNPTHFDGTEESFGLATPWWPEDRACSKMASI